MFSLHPGYHAGHALPFRPRPSLCDHAPEIRNPRRVGSCDSSGKPRGWRCHRSHLKGPRALVGTTPCFDDDLTPRGSVLSMSCVCSMTKEIQRSVFPSGASSGSEVGSRASWPRPYPKKVSCVCVCAAPGGWMPDGDGQNTTRPESSSWPSSPLSGFLLPTSFPRPRLPSHASFSQPSCFTFCHSLPGIEPRSSPVQACIFLSLHAQPPCHL